MHTSTSHSPVSVILTEYFLDLGVKLCGQGYSEEEFGRAMNLVCDTVDQISLRFSRWWDTLRSLEQNPIIDVGDPENTPWKVVGRLVKDSGSVQLPVSEIEVDPRKRGILNRLWVEALLVFRTDSFLTDREMLR